MIERKTINGVSFLYEVYDPNVDDINVIYKPGATIKELGQVVDVAINFNYADTVKGLPIGRLIIDGVEVVHDIPKTVARDELYMLPDKSLHIGKSPANAVWAVQGSPPLLKDGFKVVSLGVIRDQLGKDIWSGKAYRSAVGITVAGNLVIVRTMDKIVLDELAAVMLKLGCINALNGDGGGSSYLWPEDNGWGRKLGSALVVKRGEPKMKLIALCDGHGMETAGKRTPTLPDGTIMRENEFNSCVVELLDVHLKRCGFNTLLVAPTDVDTPLKERTDTANDANADLYLSVHANAIGAGEWNGTRGIETFHHTKSSEASKKVAAIIHRHLIGGTKLPDRGVKTADFHVLRETHMPAVLVECAFMTNKEDAKLLLSDAYRAECAEELARGVCEYFGVTYVREAREGITAIVFGQKIEGAKLIDGVTMLPLRAVGNAIGGKVSWDPNTQTARIDK